MSMTLRPRYDSWPAKEREQAKRWSDHIRERCQRDGIPYPELDAEGNVSGAVQEAGTAPDPGYESRLAEAASRLGMAYMPPVVEGRVSEADRPTTPTSTHAEWAECVAEWDILAARADQRVREARRAAARERYERTFGVPATIGTANEDSDARVVEAEAHLRALEAELAELKGDGEAERVRESIGFEVLEATGSGGDYKILIWEYGVTQDGKRRYSKAVAEQAVRDGVYDGTKTYLNHSAGTGPRDIREWVGTILPDTATATDRGLEATLHVHDPHAQVILDDPIARGGLGFSHDAYIDHKRSGNVADVTRIRRVLSVDMVHAGNARGCALNN